MFSYQWDLAVAWFGSRYIWWQRGVALPLYFPMPKLGTSLPGGGGGGGDVAVCY